MNYFRTLIFLLLITGQIISCRPKKPSPKNDSTEKEVSLDTNAVLTSWDPQYISAEEGMAQVAKGLGLSDIKSKSNEEELRIWIRCTLSDTGKIIVIKKNKKEWYSSAYYYKTKDDEKGNVVSIEKKTEENKPISGWDIVSKNLNDFGIYNLKNFDKIPEYFVCNDGDQLTIEIWKDNLYHMYDYPCFELYWDKLRDMIIVKQIFLLIQKEFKYRVFCPL